MAEASSTKAPDAFRTISEVAEELDLPQHVLRFWETRFGQIKPMKRGGGRRYYRPEDVDLLRGIRLLLYGEGFTIRGVQRLLKEKGVGFVVAVGQTGSVQTVTAAERSAAGTGADRPHRVRVDEPRMPAEPHIDRKEPVLDSEDADVPQTLHAAMRQPTFALSHPNRRRLEFVLADLIEAKRVLDQLP